jgi:predicted nuclease of predicted toxin-antitoxin system
MRVLIDECLNWRLGRALKGHFAISVQKMGWSGIKNGELLRLAVEQNFDVFLTGDRNLRFQQNVSKIGVAVIVLESNGVQLHETLPLVPKILEVLATIQRGEVVRVKD